jgi:phytoene/squalene synthetase
MKLDLIKSDYHSKEKSDYIYGSADVVGLMCLKVFVSEKGMIKVRAVKSEAMRLGSAFQSKLLA